MTLSMSIQHDASGATIAVLDGPITLGMNLRTIDSQLQSLLETDVKRLVLDLTGVTYCDSAGLGMIVHAFGLAQQKGSRLRICCVQKRVADLLTMTTVEKLLPVDATREASVAALA